MPTPSDPNLNRRLSDLNPTEREQLKRLEQIFGTRKLTIEDDPLYWASQPETKNAKRPK